MIEIFSTAIVSAPSREGVSLAELSLNPSTGSLSIEIHTVLIVLALAVTIIGLAWRFFYARGGVGQLEIDEAEIGVGNSKLKLKPNIADRQVAYQIWVELSTRKIGLPIDLDHDVIDEIYSSWYQFFSVTRDLIKAVPVSKVADPSTRAIIRLSIDVLNEGLRPHLTLWQARFRSWFEQQLKTASVYEEPQDIQKRFPKYSELTSDLIAVNAKLIAYRQTMHKLVYGT